MRDLNTDKCSFICFLRFRSTVIWDIRCCPSGFTSSDEVVAAVFSLLVFGEVSNSVSDSWKALEHVDFCDTNLAVSSLSFELTTTSSNGETGGNSVTLSKLSKIAKRSSPSKVVSPNSGSSRKSDKLSPILNNVLFFVKTALLFLSLRK